jgi:hypothetical protein
MMTVMMAVVVMKGARLVRATAARARRRLARPRACSRLLFVGLPRPESCPLPVGLAALVGRSMIARDIAASSTERATPTDALTDAARARGSCGSQYDRMRHCSFRHAARYRAALVGYPKRGSSLASFVLTAPVGRSMIARDIAASGVPHRRVDRPRAWSQVLRVAV